MTRASPEQSASWLSRLFFQWVQPTLKRGVAAPLDVEALLPLNDAESPSLCDAAFRSRLAADSEARRPVLKAMAALHWRTFARVFAVSMIHLTSSVSSPLLLRELLKSLGGAAAREHGLMLAGLLFVTAAASSFSAHHIFHML